MTKSHIIVAYTILFRREYMEHSTFNKISVAFFGHRHIENLNIVEEKLMPILRNFIREHSYVEFYIGRNGEFDEYVASIIKRVQKEICADNSSLIFSTLRTTCL